MSKRREITAPIKATITEVQVLNPTDAGRPRYRLHWRSTIGERAAATTASDVNYRKIDASGIRVGDEVVITLSPSGTIDCIESRW
jgi:hypothetical protein